MVTKDLNIFLFAVMARTVKAMRIWFPTGERRAVEGVKAPILERFVEPDMRGAIRDCIGSLIYSPYFLLKSISAKLGVYNPKLGYGHNASWLHQVPPGLEAHITYELYCAFKKERPSKSGKQLDLRPSTLEMLSVVTIHVLNLSLNVLTLS